jgi:translation elongation factor EF-Tu-like GTPase
MTRRLMQTTVDLVPADQGGRTGAIRSGYWSLIRFDGTDVDFGCELERGEPPLAPGARGAALLSLWAVDELPALAAGQPFELREGTRVVGRGTIDDPDAVP